MFFIVAVVFISLYHSSVVFTIPPTIILLLQARCRVLKFVFTIFIIFNIFNFFLSNQTNLIFCHIRNHYNNNNDYNNRRNAKSYYEFFVFFLLSGVSFLSTITFFFFPTFFLRSVTRKRLSILIVALPCVHKRLL